MKKVHYGWVMVVAAFLVLGCTAGQMNCYGLLIVPVCEELGIARSAMGLSQSLVNVGGILVPMLAGLIFGRVRLKRLMILAGAVMALGFFSFSLARNIVHIYISMIVVSIAFALVAWLPFSILMNNWFHEKRGMAIGLAFMGSGVGGMIFSTLGGVLIANLGWRSMVQIYALIAALVNLPVLIFVVKEKPEDMGLLPYGMTEHTHEIGAQQELGGALFSEERKKPQMWILLLCVVMVCFVMNGFGATVAAYVQDSGYSGTFAANVAAGYMGSLAVAKIILGTLYDKFGAKRGTIVSFSALLLCMISLLFVKYTPSIAGIVLGSGLGVAFNTVALPILSRHTFGNRDYSAFTGLFTAANNIGGMFSPTIFGAICDLFGSYSYAYGLSIGIVITFGLVLVRLLPAKPRV